MPADKFNDLEWIQKQQKKKLSYKCFYVCCHLMRLQINRGKLWKLVKDMQIMNEHKNKTTNTQWKEKSNPLTQKITWNLLASV